MSVNSSTAPMASGNISPTDFDKANPTKAADTKADSVRDRASKSLVKDLPPGAPKPANAK